MTFYTEKQRELQDQFGKRNLANAAESAIITETLDDRHTGFIASRDFFFLSTVNEREEPTVSHKGGAVGIVRASIDQVFLTEKEQARTAAAGGTITEEEYGAKIMTGDS